MARWGEMRGRGEEEGVWGKEVRNSRSGKRESDAGEFRLGLAPLLTGWHLQGMRQHTLSSSFVIHAVNMRYEVIRSAVSASAHAKPGLIEPARQNVRV